ncbi:hypothetical protein PACTADRAFT_51404 [Pachysolen tannophilus NRRL Y-2460]|uniref:Uncharacterized protein n=1 Tax=Pachysolen tannophilus NRRL Y-2460 TaxID=669874 RepID=A0A1E4TPM7_PACTA|nr:hypothetical protein PACTADRAFT_51404 [Pachysolen tannophilus NRRL Y-2460]
MSEEDKQNKNPHTSLSAISKLYRIDLFKQQNLLIPSNSLADYTELINPNSYNKEDFTPSSNIHVLMGQGIRGNGGLELSQLMGNKLPNYEDVLNNKANVVVHHKKTMLDGLLLSSGIDIPLAKNFNDISSKLLQLPIEKLNVNNGKQERSINGLPYYSEAEAKFRLKELVKENKLYQLEYTHGAVIANQFSNNKRKIRNYQWGLYFNDRMGNSKFNNMKAAIRRNINENAKIVEEEQTDGNVSAPQQFPSVVAPTATVGASTSSNQDVQAKLQEQLQEQIQRSIAQEEERSGKAVTGNNSNSSEKDREVEEREKAKLERQNTLKRKQEENEISQDAKKRKRFIYTNQEYIEQLRKDSIVIQEEVVTPNIHYIPSMQTNQPHEIIKLVKKRRRPNPNSIGHSNIRGVKPTYYR